MTILTGIVIQVLFKISAKFYKITKIMDPNKFENALILNADRAEAWDSPPICLPVTKGIESNDVLLDFKLNDIMGTYTKKDKKQIDRDVAMSEGYFLVDCTDRDHMQNILINACKKAGFIVATRTNKKSATGEFITYYIQCSCRFRYRTNRTDKGAVCWLIRYQTTNQARNTKPSVLSSSEACKINSLNISLFNPELLLLVVEKEYSRFAIAA